ncbi:MAG TPA: SpoIIE family protein phosphatase [Phycisphaerae bacterium]|nr:SpoIIE family protein phosphatase [Phycisphaerae bacterium]
MSAALLTIVDNEGGVRETPLEPGGTVIGRGRTSDVVLDSPRVSRHHARIFADPFGRWIIEDLGSRNGVRIDDRRVEASVIEPGQKAYIGPFMLIVSEPYQRPIARDPSAPATTTLVNGPATESVEHVDTSPDQPLSHPRLRQLNEITDRLARLTNPKELYPELCQCLARRQQSAALVVRLPNATLPLAGAVEILACHLSDDPSGGSATPEASSVHLSRRVLEAVRRDKGAVMGRSRHATDEQISLTLVDARQPRAVLCAPITEMAETMDVIYLDLPWGETLGDAMDFVTAVARQVNLTRQSLLLAEARAERRVLDHQLAVAREIQGRLTPTEPKDIPGLDVAIHYQPAMWVGGDYCDVWQLGDGRVAFAVGDVSGKGLPAAMVMANLQAALRSAVSLCPDLPRAIAHVNGHLRQSVPDRMFVTLFVGIIDCEDGTLRYVNAGHEDVLVVRPHGAVSALARPPSPLLGVFDEPFQVGIEQIGAGSALVMVTDGITEAMSPTSDLFGLDGVKKTLEAVRLRSAQEMVSAVTKATSSFRHTRPQHDDLTAMAIVYGGTAEPEMGPSRTTGTRATGSPPLP